MSFELLFLKHFVSNPETSLVFYGKLQANKTSNKTITPAIVSRRTQFLQTTNILCDSISKMMYAF